MPRPILIRTDEFPYHVTCRTNNKDWFYVDMQECWNIFSKYLNVISEKYDPKIISFVLMSNHFHLLISTPLLNIDEIMNHLLREVSKQIGLRASRINHVFGGRYKWSVIQNDRYFSHVYKYVYRNPVNAGVVKKVQDYEFSTIHNLLRPSSVNIPSNESFLSDLIPEDISQRLEWLNEPYRIEQNDLIRKALRKSNFAYNKHKDCTKWIQALDPKR